MPLIRLKRVNLSAEGVRVAVVISAPRQRRWPALLWTLAPLLFGLPAAPCFGWAAWRLRSRQLAAEAAVYLAATVMFIALDAQRAAGLQDAGGLLCLALAVAATGRGLAIRSRVFPAAAATPAARVAAGAAAPPGWQPSFPAAQPPARDPNDPATWIASLGCTGSDGHPLSVTPLHTLGYSLVGVALVTGSLALHVYGRGLGAGIVMALSPAFAALFARRVDGAVLTYRSWGRRRQLRLDTVTAVSTPTKARRGLSLQLAAPGLRPPVTLVVASPTYTLSNAARDHLQGWLEHPGAMISPTARALLDGTSAGRVARRSPAWRRRTAILVVGVLPLALACMAGALALERRAALAIPGAPGYRTFTGPAGKPLAVGRPWGGACQPVRVAVTGDVPTWAYQQIAAVVITARQDGIDITPESRTFSWLPGSLYYPPGQSPGTVRQVPVFASTGTPPRLGNGAPEHIDLEWDAALTPGGGHEELTGEQAVLYLQALHGSPAAARLAARQLVAFTQGILSTSAPGSGITDGSGTDAFTPADIAAMKLMSGCGNDVPSA